MAVDPALVEAWLAGRSISRGLPLPVRDHGGLRVDSGQATERCRYVFPAPGDGLRRLGEEIDAPLVALKLCGSGAELMAMLPPRWMLASAHWMMILEAPRPAPPVPAGYELTMNRDGAVTVAAIRDSSGLPAAGGRAVEHEGAFVFDQILTEERHRRRGLGSALMGALLSARTSPASRPVLTATDAGRALYLQLGWRDYCPYATAFIPVAAA